MKERPWLKWIAMFLCLVFAVFIFFMFIRVRRENEAERAELRKIASEYEETMRPLWNEKSRLEREISELEKTVAAEAPPSAVILLCTEPSERILTDIFPIADRYGYPAAIVLSEDALPGDPGCLTAFDVSDLCAQGWELCIGAEEDTDIAALYQWITDAALPAPAAVYFPSDSMTLAQELEIHDLGLQTVISYGKDVPENDVEGIWRLSAYGSNASDSKNVFLTYQRNAAPLALTVGYSNSREQFSETNFGNMLKTVNTYEKSGDVMVTHIQDASAEHFMRLSGTFQEPETLAERHLRELKERLSEINAEIWDLE